ncbi:MAG: hypothetical protein HRU36_02090 [Rickettsiales bacterium]|nr:hypothetical protein [Rickettsiales bacterium]
MTVNTLYKYYKEGTLEQLASQAIKLQDYPTLKDICKTHTYARFIGLRDTGVHLDLEAVKIVFQNTNFTNTESELTAFDHIPWFFPNGNRHDCNYYNDQKQVANIVLYTLEWKLSKNFTLSYRDTYNIELLSFYEIKKFLNKHTIENLKAFSSKTELKLINNEVKEDINQFLPQDTCPTGEFGPILSHTYSTTINLDQALHIYQTIYNVNTIGRTIISQLNKNIIDGDDVMIFFINNKSPLSHFHIEKNSITINLANKYIPAETITAHEIAHYIIQTIFRFYTLPNNICHSLNDEDPKLQYVGEWKNIKSKEEFYGCTSYTLNRCFDVRISEFIKAYNDATKDILFKTADLLQITEQVQEYEPYIAQDLATYIATSHPIISILFADPTRKLETFNIPLDDDTFLHNTITSIMTFPEFADDLPHDIMVIGIIDTMNERIKHKDKVIKDQADLINQLKHTNAYPKPINETVDAQTTETDKWLTSGMLDHIRELLTTKYLPKMIKKLGLNEAQTYFLSRAADLVHRKGIDFEAEPVVRCIELATQNEFMDIPQDIIDSCSKMNKFWEDYILPHIDENFNL